jgi:hypothetical protein
LGSLAPFPFIVSATRARGATMKDYQASIQKLRTDAADAVDHRST